MYRHWDSQRKKVLEAIYNKQCAVCQVVYGTNYSIFFRNIHSDLILKKNIVPVYVDLNHLTAGSLVDFFNLVLFSLRRAMQEKKFSVKSGVVSESIDGSLSQLNDLLAEISARDFRIVIFFEDIDHMFKEHDSFDHLETLRKKFQNCLYIYLTKTNFNHPNTMKAHLKHPHIYENNIYFPVRDEKAFKAVEKASSPKTLNIIYSLTGGIDKFQGIAMDLKNNLSLRERKNLRNHISTNQTLKNELHRLWDHFNDSEVAVLTKVVWGETLFSQSHSHDLAHLVNLGVIRKEKKGYELVIGLLKMTGTEKSKGKNTVLNFNKDRVTINGNAVPLKLTQSEKKVLKYLLDNKNKIVGKGAISKFIPSSRVSKGLNYEVVDKTILRLKDKLSDLWVDSGNLVSVENRGFIYRESL